MTEHKFPYHGTDKAFRAKLCAPDGMFSRQAPSFCLINMLGQFLDRIDDAFAMPHVIASIHIPVVSKGVTETVHADIEAQIDWQDKDLYDETMDHLADITKYVDGYLKITKFEGPRQWRTENWTKATITVAGMDKN